MNRLLIPKVAKLILGFSIVGSTGYPLSGETSGIGEIGFLLPFAFIAGALFVVDLLMAAIWRSKSKGISFVFGLSAGLKVVVVLAIVLSLSGATGSYVGLALRRAMLVFQLLSVGYLVWNVPGALRSLRESRNGLYE